MPGHYSIRSIRISHGFFIFRLTVSLAGLPEWPAFDEKEQQVLYIDAETGARKHPDLDKIMAFDAYFAQVREEAKTEE